MAVVLIGGATLLIAPAWASAAPITFNFADCGEITPPLGSAHCPNADSGKSTLTYMSGGLSITANGYLISSTTGTDLYVKQGGSTAETGLGIFAGGTDHEINSQYVVDLDVSNLVTPHGITSGDLTLSSVQNGESYKVCIESTAGSVASNSSCKTGTGGNIVTLHNFAWDATHHFIAITSPGTGTGDVLVASSLVATVPEPATMVLFGTGAMGLALIRRRLGGRVQP